MRFKKFSFVLAVIMCLSICLQLGTLKVSANTPNVELFNAQLDTGYHQGHICGYKTRGNIAIKNIGTDKTVTVHYTHDGVNWYDKEATYTTTLSNGLEVWSYFTPNQSYYPPHQYNYYCKFAIKYEVDGQVYWDNNNGNDYFLQESSMNTRYPFILNKSVVKLHNTTRYNGGLKGTIALKNLAYAKDVKVRFSIDNWATYHEVSASYNESFSNNTELWSFDTADSNVYIMHLQPGQFAISYTVNGFTYWDNNFEMNYEIGTIHYPTTP